jgi:biotin carboxyl carrier protein
MHYEIEAGGRIRHVAVTRVGDGFAITVDGRPYRVDAARIDAHTLSLVVDNVWRTSYDVTVTPDGAAGQLSVYVGAVHVSIALNGRRGWGRKEDHGASGSRPQRVAAPMPGKVVRVLVAAGDTVKARQPLVVVEAMKMENELRAGRDGTIAEVHAREGVSVEAGALLVVIQ